MSVIRITRWERFDNRTFGRWFRNINVRRKARRDAKRGRRRDLDALCGKYVELDIPWDQANNPFHRQLAIEDRAEGLADDHATVKQSEREFSRHVHPRTLLVVFVLLVLLETLGNSLVTRDLGVEGLERWIFALLLSLAVFLLVYLSSEHQPKKGFNMWYALTIACLACVVVAITLMRITHGTGESLVRDRRGHHLWDVHDRGRGRQPPRLRCLASGQPRVARPQRRPTTLAGRAAPAGRRSQGSTDRERHELVAPDPDRLDQERIRGRVAGRGLGHHTCTES